MLGSSVPSGLLAPEWYVLPAMVGATLIAGEEERAPAESDRAIARDELIRNDISIECGCELKRGKGLSRDGKRIPTVRSWRRGQRSNHRLIVNCDVFLPAGLKLAAVRELII